MSLLNYVKNTWVAHETEVTAEKLNHIEQGIYDVSQKVDTLPLPETSPTANGTYKLSCTVANGIVSYSWVADN